MSSSAIEALYILDQHGTPILEHVYRGRPPTSRALLPLYMERPQPRPPMIYLPNLNPPTILFSLSHTNVLLFVPSSREVEPLLVLEFLHRLCDVLEDFLGAPLLASRIEHSYDVVAQLLAEMCDAGAVSNTEPNALRDVVEVPGWVDKFLGGVGLPASSPALTPAGGFKKQISLQAPQLGPAIPWRRANVKHTSNELYVDIVETLSVILAPSGRPLTAKAHGSILFTSKLSGVPDLVLGLSVPGGKHTLDKIIELPTFHPCVRLTRWKERPGELSFVPPDGKFLLAGYEVNLLPGGDLMSRSAKKLNLPALIEVDSSLGPSGADFEVRLMLSPSFAGSSNSGQGRPVSGANQSKSITTNFFGGSSGSSAAPSLRDVVVTVPLPAAVRNASELRASRGEASFTPTSQTIEWRLSTKDVSVPGTATLRGTVLGPYTANGDSMDDDNDEAGSDAAIGDYDETTDAYQEHAEPPPVPKAGNAKGKGVFGKQDKDVAGVDERDSAKVEQNSLLMPRGAALSFSVKGWLPSGIKVESLNIDMKRSRGVGESVRPVKGAKYLTVCKKGLETRC